MAELRSSTSIGGNLAWHTGNLRFDTQGNTIRYAGFKLYSENDKPTTTELNVYSKQESDTKYALVSGANYVSKTLNETMAGSLTVNGNELAVTGFAPRVSLTETDTGKTWWTVADGNDFSIRESTLGNIVFNISGGGTGVNFNANSFKLNAKEAINGADSWLRLNGTGTFTSGIFTPGSIRVDGSIQTGDSTVTGLYVNTSAFSWKGTEVFTANNYTTLDARFVNATGDTMTGPLNISMNNSSSNLIKLVNETDGWTWMRMGKTTTHWGDFAWNTTTIEGHAANAFHFRPIGGNTVLGISSGAATIGSNSYIEFLPNSSWGAKLRVGGNGRTAPNDGITASVSTTNGNVHIDGASGSRGVYLNFYAGTAGTAFGNGAGATVGTVDAAGNMVMNGTITAPTVNTKTIQGQGSSIAWASIDVTGTKGGYAGFNFTDAGHWFGVQPNGLSGVWNSAGTSKWYFNENGWLGGGAVVPWNIIADHPSRTNWASKADVVSMVTGQLAWKNYGNGHSIFDASAGTSPDGTAVDKNNAQIAWRADGANYPTLMGWNGANTYGVRVDSARVADGAGWADGAAYANRLNGDVIKTSGQDLTFWDKRVMVGNNSANQLIINYGNDWGSTLIQGQLYTHALESNRHTIVHNGATTYGSSGLEVRTTDGSDARIGFHRSGHSAASINHSAWGFQFERESGAGSRANVAAANFFADAPQDMTGNALTRLDYVLSQINSPDTFRFRGQKTDANVSLGTGSYYWHPTVTNAPIGNTFAHGIQFGGNVYANGSWVSDIAFIHGHGLYHRASVNGGFADWAKFAFAQEVNYTTTPTQYRSNSSWIGLVSGMTGTDAVVIGTNSGAATIGGHSNGLDAWTPLYVNCHPNSGTTAPLVLSAPKVKLPDNNTLYDVWHSGNFNPDSKLSENGHYGGTLKLNNWFRSVGDSGWFSETHGGGIHMDEATTVKVYGGKKFYSANTEYNAIGATGGIFSYQRMSVDTRQQIGNGGSFQSYRSIDAPFHAGHGGLDAGTFAPIVGSANYTNGNGYTTRVHLGVRTVGADWTRAVLMVGSAENTAHPLATYEFDVYGNIYGINNINASTYNGLALNSTAVASTIVVRDASSDINCRLLRPEYQDDTFMDGAIAFRSTASTSNNFLRFCNSPTAVRSWLGAASTTVATTYDTGLMSSNDKAKLNNIAADKSPTETVLWSGLTTAHPTNNQIPLQFSVSGYNKLRFEFVNAGDTIGMVHTLSVSDWAAMTGTGRLIHIAVGSYSYTFGAAAYSATVLYRNTSSNCYLIRIVGLK